MIPVHFDYLAPETLEKALYELASDAEAMVIAGGQSLLPALTERRFQPTKLVDLRRLPELRGIVARDDVVRIGAMATLAEVAESELVRTRLPGLADAARALRDPLVRNRSTVGGNLLTQQRATDLPALAVALEAKLLLHGPTGRRSVPAEVALGRTTPMLTQGEILIAIELPPAPSSAYVSQRDPASGYALSGVAARIERSADGMLSRARLAVTGAVPQPMRLTRLEAMLAGRATSSESLRAALEEPAAFEGLSFASDFGASAQYKAHLAKVLTERALGQATARGSAIG